MTDPAPEPAAFLAFSGLQRMRVYAHARIMIRESGNYPAYPAYLTFTGIPLSIKHYALCIVLGVE